MKLGHSLVEVLVPYLLLVFFAFMNCESIMTRLKPCKNARRPAGSQNQTLILADLLSNCKRLLDVPVPSQTFGGCPLGLIHAKLCRLFRPFHSGSTQDRPQVLARQDLEFGGRSRFVVPCNTSCHRCTK